MVAGVRPSAQPQAAQSARQLLQPSPGPRAWIPAEALVTFHLTAPVTVNPVGREEAARLAQGLYPGGPNLYRRGYYGGPYGSPYGPTYPYPSYYAPVYYRPYYFSGGYYYWR